MHDLAGLTQIVTPTAAPVIWVLWHNRLLIVPILYERFFRDRKGAALISHSKDGALLAGCIERFGGEAVRGSSSRGGSSALSILRRKLEDGYDIYITPDGPRGPRYTMGPGAVWLARSSGASILPLNVEYSSFWRLGRWDGFVIPKPFARIDVTLQKLYTCNDAGADAAGNEQERLHELLMSGTTLR